MDVGGSHIEKSIFVELSLYVIICTHIIQEEELLYYLHISYKVYIIIIIKNRVFLITNLFSKLFKLKQLCNFVCNINQQLIVCLGNKVSDKISLRPTYFAYILLNLDLPLDVQNTRAGTFLLLATDLTAHLNLFIQYHSKPMCITLVVRIITVYIYLSYMLCSLCITAGRDGAQTKHKFTLVELVWSGVCSVRADQSPLYSCCRPVEEENQAQSGYTGKLRHSCCPAVVSSSCCFQVI